MKTLTLTIALLFAALVAAPPAATAALDVAGTWKAIGDVAGHAIDATIVLKQDGDALSGTVEFAGGIAKPATLSGTLKDATATLMFTIVSDQGTYDMTWAGTVGSDGVMKGTIDVQQGMASGEFTAKRP